MSNVFQSLGLLVLRISIKRTSNRNTNVVRISIAATCFPLRGKCRKQYVQANWIFRSVATLKSSETSFRAQRNGACQRPSNNAQYTVVLPPQPSGQLPRWGAKNVLPLNLIALPRWGGSPAGRIGRGGRQGRCLRWKMFSDPRSLHHFSR